MWHSTYDVNEMNSDNRFGFMNVYGLGNGARIYGSVIYQPRRRIDSIGPLLSTVYFKLSSATFGTYKCSLNWDSYDVGIVTCMHTCCKWLLLYATSTHSLSICPFTRPHFLISALFMHFPPALWAWIRAPATHFFGRTDPYYTDIFYSSCGLKRHAATLAFPLLCNCTVLTVPLSTGP